MNSPQSKNPFIAIACGGTGGHLFPGISVAEQLKQRGCDVALLISPKDVDQKAVKSAKGMQIFTLPAVGLQNRNYFSFAVSFAKSIHATRKFFQGRKPVAVVAMGGFTSAPPIFAAKWIGAKTFLHESNTIPGKANRYLARFVDEAFVGFSETAARLRAKRLTTTGTPVRPQFFKETEGPDSQAVLTLGFAADRPVILVVGGSQGASGLNAMVISALPLLAHKNWQWLHLTGTNDFESVKTAYAKHNLAAIVKPFFAEMDLALNAATAAVSRAGASSLAEIAAARVPSLLVPFPAAADNHQFFNARAFHSTGAAYLLEQRQSTPEEFAARLTDLVEVEPVRGKMMAALKGWSAPNCASEIAARILSVADESGTTAIGSSVAGKSNAKNLSVA